MGHATDPLRGQTYHVEYASRMTIVAGEPQRVIVDDTITVVTGRVRFADGTEHWAICEIDESSFDELTGLGLLRADGQILWTDTPMSVDEDLLRDLGLDQTAVYPYRYRLDTESRVPSHYLAADGWSISFPRAS